MCTQCEQKQVNVTVNLGCCSTEPIVVTEPDSPPTTEPIPTGDCENKVIPFGKKLVFRNEANKDSLSCEPLLDEIYIGYYNGVYGTYRYKNEILSETIKQTLNS